MERLLINAYNFKSNNHYINNINNINNIDFTFL